MHKKPLILALLTGIALSGAAQAALHDRGGGLIYDDVQNITWLADANYAATQFANSGGALGDEDGRMNWADANAWAAGLSYGGFEDWRLPTALNQDGSGPCLLYGCTGSEMGHLFNVDLSGQWGFDILTSGDPDLAKFSNVQHYYYWSREQQNTDDAWYFLMGTAGAGIQANNLNKTSDVYAWAVRTGDVAAAPVPEPETYALMLAGLGLVGWAVKRRRG